jgi:hypothetical protein
MQLQQLQFFSRFFYLNQLFVRWKSNQEAVLQAISHRIADVVC